MRAYKKALRSFYTYAVNEGWAKSHPFARRKPWGALDSSGPTGRPNDHLREPDSRLYVDNESKDGRHVDYQETSRDQNDAADGLVDEVLELVGLPRSTPRQEGVAHELTAASVVYVPVPTARLQEVYELLASSSAAASPVPDEAEFDADDFDPWDEDLLSRMYRESGATLKAFFDYLAKSPGRFFAAEEVAKALRLKKGTASLGGMLGALGNRCYNRYQRDAPYLMEWLDTASGWERTYSIEPEVANVVNACREALK